MKSLLFASAAILSAPSAWAQSSTSEVCNSPLGLIPFAGMVCESEGHDTPLGGVLPNVKRPDILLLEMLNEAPRWPPMCRRPVRSGYEDQGEFVAPHPVEDLAHPCDIDRASFDCAYERRWEEMQARLGGF